MSSKSKLIIVTGHPGSGKTTLAREFGARYGMIVLSKDAIKERIFDGLGSKDKDWSLKVSGVAHRIMDDIIEQELGRGRSVVVESNFKPEVDSERFTRLVKKHHADCIQVLCQADPEVLFDRWKERIAKGERHEGHIEKISLDQIRRDREIAYEPLDVPGKLIVIDTSDFNELIVPSLVD